jgi:hypothetical protein
MRFTSISQGSVRSDYYRSVRAICLAFGSLLLVHAALFDDGRVYPQSTIAKTDKLRELDYRRNGPKSPEVVILGTSRLLGISANQFADDLQIKEDRVANLSAEAMQIWRNVALIRRNPGIVRSAKCVIIDYLPYQLRSEDYVKDEAFLRWANVKERFAVTSRGARASALVNVVLPLWVRPQSINDSFSFYLMKPSTRYELLSSEVGETREKIWRPKESQNRQSNIFIWASLIAPEIPQSRLNIQALTDLFNQLPQDCTVIFVNYPITGRPRKYIDSDPAQTTIWSDARQSIEDICAEAPRRSVLVWIDSMSEMGLNNDDYLKDGFHFGESGLRRVSKWNAKLVHEHVPMLTNGNLR